MQFVSNSLRSLCDLRRLAALLVAFGATVIFATVTPAFASAATVADKWINVREADGLVPANVEVQNGDEVDISATGSIWAGVWFTGRNGPDGWLGWSANNDSPLPGVAPFSLLGHTSVDGHFVVGRGRRWTYQNATLGSGRARLNFEINDDSHGNGNGSFQVHIVVRR